MDVHFEKQGLKYDNFEKKIFSIFWNVVKFFGAVALVCTSVVGITWLAVQSKASTTSVEELKEVVKKDVLHMTTAKRLIDLSGKYYDQRFIRKDGVTVDPSNYEWFIETTFGDQERGAYSTKKMPPIEVDKLPEPKK